DRRDVTSAKPVDQRYALMRSPLESRVGGGVLTLVEDGVEWLRIKVRVEGGTVGASDAMRWPAMDEVGGVGEVIAGVDVVVAGRHDVFVSRALARVERGVLPLAEDLRDPECDVGTTAHRKAP